jgi:hypothetical protein
MPREVPLPVTTTLPGSAYSLAADPTNADHLIFSNTHAVMLSTDGGCTWSVVFKLDPSPTYPRINGATDDVSSLAIQGDYIYVHVFHRAASIAGTGASIFYSHDLGKTFAQSTNGFPPPSAWYTWPTSLDVSTKDPKTVYFATESYAGAAGLDAQGQSLSANLDPIYASTDGGITWTERPPPTGRASGLLQDVSAQIAVDGRDPATLWSYAPNGHTYRSADGGNSWTEIATMTPDPVNGIRSMDTIDGGAFSSILGVPVVPRGNGIDGNFVLRSDDGGQSFYKLTSGLFPPENAIFVGSPKKVVMRVYSLPNGADSLLRLDSRSNSWVDITPSGVEKFLGELASRSGSKPIFFTFNEDAIYRFSGRL